MAGWPFTLDLSFDNLVNWKSFSATIHVWSSIRVFPKWNRNSPNSSNSGNLMNHWCMNWSQFIDPDSNMCPAGTNGSILVSNTRGGKFESFYCNDKYFCNWIQQIQWKHLRKLNCHLSNLISDWSKFNITKSFRIRIVTRVSGW